jgi:hypothetical protein
MHQLASRSVNFDGNKGKDKWRLSPWKTTDAVLRPMEVLGRSGTPQTGRPGELGTVSASLDPGR